MRTLVAQAERLSELGEGMAREREGAPRNRERIEERRQRKLASGALRLLAQKHHVKGRSVGDQDRLGEQGLELRKHLGKTWRWQEVFSLYAVNPFIAEATTLGPNQRINTRQHLIPAHQLRAKLDHTILLRLQACHLEIDEQEIRLLDRTIPVRKLFGRSRGRRSKATNGAQRSAPSVTKNAPSSSQ